MGLDIWHAFPSVRKEDEYITIDKFESVPHFITRHQHLFYVVDDLDQGRTLAVNWSEKGYQRKGMRSEFYDEFENEKLYFDIASVIKAKLYLEVSANRPDLDETFQREFIDNFVEGESFFFAVW